MIKYMQEMYLIMKIFQAKKLIHKIKIYRLYMSAFPKSERKPFSVILKMQKNGKSDLWFIESDGKFIGMAATINSSDPILLDYFAISPTCRGKGFGTEVLKKLRSLYPDKGFFLEIEIVCKSAENYNERFRRK